MLVLSRIRLGLEFPRDWRIYRQELLPLNDGGDAPPQQTA